METVQKIGTNIFRITLAVTVTLVAMLLFGCSDDVDMTLLRTDISLAVGESRNISPYVMFSAVAQSSIALSANSDCIQVDGTVVTAVKEGTAELRVSAHGKTEVMKISVSYRTVQDFDLIAENAVQTVGVGDKILPVVLSVGLESYVNPQTEAQWKMGDVVFEGSRFEFTPQGIGEYAVSVAVGDIQKQCAVKVYRRTDVTVKHTDLNNVKAFTPVTFTAYESENTLNPVSVYEWRVNGEAVGDGPILEFTPTDGDYAVSLFVNGERKKIDGKDELVFGVAGDAATDCRVVYDDVNGVYVYWAKQRKVLYVSIVSPTGKRSTFDVTDAQHAHLFGDESFRATEYIDVCAVNPASYTIIIGTDDGRREFNFMQLGEQAKSYLEDKVLFKNAFISSEADAREFVRELYALGKTSATCYAVSTDSAERAVREQAEMLNLSATTVKNGNVLTVTFAPYANKPTIYESKTVNSVYAQLPHIDYSDNRRPNDYVFMSDRSAKAAEVRGSEQLLLAVNSGIKPITKTGDIAEGIYRAAKSVLLRIIGADYTQRQKVHAVYDWLQWVTVNVESVDASSASRFLEGVFASSREKGCVVTSEGAAKSFALLCGMEGIECVIEFDADYGYYNRVKLNNLWYNVDVYGGKIKITGSAQSSSGTAVEMTSHRGLLIGDEQLKAMGCGTVDGRAFDGSNTEFVVKHTAYGAYFDYYITESELDYEAVRAAVFYAFDGTVRGNTRIPHVSSEVIIFNNTYGVEFELDQSLTDEQVIAVTAHINRAINEYAKNVLNNATFAGMRTVKADNIIVAIAESPRAEV